MTWYFEFYFPVPQLALSLPSCSWMLGGSSPHSFARSASSHVGDVGALDLAPPGILRNPYRRKSILPDLRVLYEVPGDMP